MNAGYSGTPLSKKLGLKPGVPVLALAMPKDVRELIAGEAPEIEWVRQSGDVQAAWVFATQLRELSSTLTTLRKSLQPNAYVWVSWPKKTSRVPTDITENKIREIAFANKLVDVKVCAITAVWSGLKLVIRLTDR